MTNSRYLSILAATALTAACSAPTATPSPDADAWDAVSNELPMSDAPGRADQAATDRPDLSGLPWVTDQTFADLEWSPLSPEKMAWKDARAYCAAMKGRLPTISELRKVIMNCPGSTFGGDCKVTESDPRLLSQVSFSNACECPNSAEPHSALGDDGSVVLWSSSLLKDSEAGDVWVVFFGPAEVNFCYAEAGGNVRCVK